MGKKTLAQIEAQIERLRQEAEEIRSHEIAGVVARIRDAIKHYNLTPAELFGKPAGAKGKGRGKRGAAGGAAKTARKPGVIKYRDEAGHAWTGHGKRPRWYVEALASGKTPEDLLVK